MPFDPILKDGDESRGSFDRISCMGDESFADCIPGGSADRKTHGEAKGNRRRDEAAV